MKLILIFSLLVINSADASEGLKLTMPIVNSSSVTECTGGISLMTIKIIKADASGYTRILGYAGKQAKMTRVEKKLPWQVLSAGVSMSSVNEKPLKREYKLKDSNFPEGYGTLELGKKYTATLVGDDSDKRSPIKVAITVTGKKKITNPIIGPGELDVYEVKSERVFNEPAFKVENNLIFHPATNSIVEATGFIDGKKWTDCKLVEFKK